MVELLRAERDDAHAVENAEVDNLRSAAHLHINRVGVRRGTPAPRPRDTRRVRCGISRKASRRPRVSPRAAILSRNNRAPRARAAWGDERAPYRAPALAPKRDVLKIPGSAEAVRPVVVPVWRNSAWRRLSAPSKSERFSI